MFRTLGVMCGKTKKGAVTSIKLPINPEDDPDHPDTQMHQIFDQELMSTEIIHRNQRHFGQSKGSPPTDPTVVKHLGLYGEHGQPGLQ